VLIRLKLHWPDNGDKPSPSETFASTALAPRLRIIGLVDRIPEFNPRWEAQRQPLFSTRSELDGLVRAGMKKEALRLVRRMLKSPTVREPAFSDALGTILSVADKVKPWKALVEAAYERLPRSDRPKVRFWMMSIRSSSKDYAGVLSLVPKRFTGPWALLELITAMEATFETNNKELMRQLALRLPRAIEQAEFPWTQARLCLCLAEVCAREGEWDDAIQLMEPVHENLEFVRNAVETVVEAHAALALKAVQRGFQKIEAFRKEFDPQMELTLPGNNKAILDNAAKGFRRLQKRLNKILPAKRQKELGFE
jgi:hypothetical protein